MWPLYPVRGARAMADAMGSTQGVHAVDDSTVVLELEEPPAIFPTLLAMPVASVVPDRVGADVSEKPVGTGPWTLVEWKHGDYLEFARNASDFGGAPAIDTRIARFVPEPITAVAEFEAGTVDLLYLPEDQTRE